MYVSDLCLRVVLSLSCYQSNWVQLTFELHKKGMLTTFLQCNFSLEFPEIFSQFSHFGMAECLPMLVIQRRFPNLSWQGNPWWACSLYMLSPQPLDVKTQNVLYSLQIHISHNVLWYGFCPTCTSCSLYSLAAPWPYSLNNDPEVSQKGSNQDPHTEKKQLMTIKHRLLKLENNHTTHMMELYRIILKASCILFAWITNLPAKKTR